MLCPSLGRRDLWNGRVWNQSQRGLFFGLHLRLLPGLQVVVASQVQDAMDNEQSQFPVQRLAPR